MANPTLGAFTDMKKVARCLIQSKSIVWEYRYQDPPSMLTWPRTVIGEVPIRIGNPSREERGCWEAIVLKHGPLASGLLLS